MNRLILALGSNIHNPLENLLTARKFLQIEFREIKASRVYQSDPVDYLDQPPFLNQVIEYQCQYDNPYEIIQMTQEIEKKMHRNKSIPKGPRNIDIDIIFLNDLELVGQRLTIPHPHWQHRSFVVYPLQELPSGAYYLNRYPLNSPLNGKAQVYSKK